MWVGSPDLRYPSRRVSVTYRLDATAVKYTRSLNAFNTMDCSCGQLGSNTVLRLLSNPMFTVSSLWSIMKSRFSRTLLKSDKYRVVLKKRSCMAYVTSICLLPMRCYDWAGGWCCPRTNTTLSSQDCGWPVYLSPADRCDTALANCTTWASFEFAFCFPCSLYID